MSSRFVITRVQTDVEGPLPRSTFPDHRRFWCQNERKRNETNNARSWPVFATFTHRINNVTYTTFCSLSLSLSLRNRCGKTGVSSLPNFFPSLDFLHSPPTIYPWVSDWMREKKPGYLTRFLSSFVLFLMFCAISLVAVSVLDAVMVPYICKMTVDLEFDKLLAQF